MPPTEFPPPRPSLHADLLTAIREVGCVEVSALIVQHVPPTCPAMAVGHPRRVRGAVRDLLKEGAIREVGPGTVRCV